MLRRDASHARRHRSARRAPRGVERRRGAGRELRGDARRGRARLRCARRRGERGRPGRTLASAAWDLGDGTTATGASLVHAYAAPGRYVVSLTVVDDLGATATLALPVVAGELVVRGPDGPVGFDERLELRGRFPAAAGETLALERRDGAGWRELARAAAGPDGAFALDARVRAGGEARVRVLGTATASAPLAFAVTPRARVSPLVGRAHLGAELRGRVFPRTYAGTVRVVVRRQGQVVARALARVRDGRLSGVVPTPGVGTFQVEIVLPARGGLAAGSVATRVRSTARPFGLGDRGADVAAFVRGIAKLRFRVPGGDRRVFRAETLDSVYAFQKAYGLPRTGRVGEAEWRRLASARPLRPRYRGPARHIEVDKTRQILLLVERGEVTAILPVSTGATGNTPEGRHAIRWKALATGTWLGPAILYRTLTFYGDSFAIHGFPSVPPYPASHGCVRIPIWIADWLYQRAPVGLGVDVYR
ncbi:MAG: L,D-transpeptidase family protein [Thermoleophilia bacterium]